MYTKPVQGGIIDYIERELDRFDYDGYEVVRHERFSKTLCPAIRSLVSAASGQSPRNDGMDFFRQKSMWLH